jgi:hypothetical protein
MTHLWVKHNEGRSTNFRGLNRGLTFGSEYTSQQILSQQKPSMVYPAAGALNSCGTMDGFCCWYSTCHSSYIEFQREKPSIVPEKGGFSRLGTFGP